MVRLFVGVIPSAEAVADLDRAVDLLHLVDGQWLGRGAAQHGAGCDIEHPHPVASPENCRKAAPVG